MTIKKFVAELKDDIRGADGIELALISFIVLIIFIPTILTLIFSPIVVFVVIVIFAGIAFAIQQTSRFLRWWASDRKET